MKKLITILLIVLPTLVTAQATFQYYDSLTYAQYQGKEYRHLLVTGNEALKAGYDYYYLRMRVGIAAYELEKFDQAVRHFSVAGDFSMDTSVAEYIYYSLLRAGRMDEMRLFYCEHVKYLPDIQENCVKAISGVYMEGGYKFSSGDIPEVGDIAFSHFGFYHTISPRLEIYQGYTWIKQKLFDSEWIRRGGMGPGPGGPVDSEIINDISIIQNEYYINLTYHPGHSGITISPAIHYQGIKGGVNNYALAMQMAQRIRGIKWRLSLAVSEINELNQQLYSVGATFYPIGDMSLFVDAEVNAQIESGKTRMVYNTKAGIKVFPSVWLEGNYGWGDMVNYADMHAFYLYNLSDVIKYRSGVSLSGQLRKKHILRTGFLYEKKMNPETTRNYTHRGFYIGLTIGL